MKLAWGKHVSEEFRRRVIGIGRELGVDPSYLMACMAFESARTFRSDIRNAAGSGAVGLIQFMPQTAAALGVTVEGLAQLAPHEQLGFVLKYFLPFKGRLRTLSDVYMAILWPSAVGKPENHVLFRRGDPMRPKLYLQNAGLDADKDSDIEKGECANKVMRLLLEGMKDENVFDETEETKYASV